jgi:hypothetical protein
MRCVIMVVLIITLVVAAAQAGPRLSGGAGLEIVELNGLKGAWGVTEDIARLVQGVAEFSPKSGLGARFGGGFGLVEGLGISKFEISILANIPLRGAGAYFGGGSGILSFGNHFYPLVQLIVGLKSEIFAVLTIFIDAKLIGVLQLTGEPLLLLGVPSEFSFGVMF